jgi:hypothetical protein
MISEIFQEVRYQTIFEKNSPLPQSQPTKLSIPEATDRRTQILTAVEPARETTEDAQTAAPVPVIDTVVLRSTPNKRITPNA